ncbi:MAG: bifunctional glutamate N-acetyltransferase/amino-acid acetyltransferase ArgJ [Candidatus Omnitrophica bacterium]|nr:bifunctional glutamate N-acetyltransferase/amino-acid acetyltransferase ArgJ [Candidatus Omnitrophota bacterium]
MAIYHKAILPAGFTASATCAGIRNNGKVDLALYYSEIPAKASCVFTANKIIAAPLVVSKKHLLASSSHQAIIANSGNANCFTGKRGLEDAEAEAGSAAKYLGLSQREVLVASTGVIGKPLPIKKIMNAVPVLVKGLSRKGIDKAKLAIMTTDTFAKEVTAQFKIGKKKVTICGIAKGAGMIAPNMATMLSFIFTDANIEKGILKKALVEAVNNSFNCITVDGCMSTNDTVIVMANGAADNLLINGGSSYQAFLKALNTVCIDLAQSIVKDGEGATKFIIIKVIGARNKSEAKTACLAIANSNLFKTAVFGENPNFGRIVAAVGASGIAVREDSIKIKVSSLKKKEINVLVSLGVGKSDAVVFTSDLTPEYVKINAEYN